MIEDNQDEFPPVDIEKSAVVQTVRIMHGDAVADELIARLRLKGYFTGLNPACTFVEVHLLANQCLQQMMPMVFEAEAVLLDPYKKSKGDKKRQRAQWRRNEKRHGK